MEGDEINNKAQGADLSFPARKSKGIPHNKTTGAVAAVAKIDRDSSHRPAVQQYDYTQLPVTGSNKKIQHVSQSSTTMETEHLVIAAKAAGASVRGELNNNVSFSVSPAVSICRTYSFPMILHALLEQAEEQSYDTIISWQYHGRAFLVHDPDDFVKKVMPHFFLQTKFASFVRQLSSYNFPRVKLKSHPDYGCYYHENFLRGIPELCQNMTRSTKEKGSCKDPEFSAPNFASMPVVGLKSRMHKISSRTASVSETHAHGQGDPSSFLQARRSSSLSPGQIHGFQLQTQFNLPHHTVEHNVLSKYPNVAFQEKQYVTDDRKPSALAFRHPTQQFLDRDSQMLPTQVPSHSFDPSQLSLLQELAGLRGTTTDFNRVITRGLNLFNTEHTTGGTDNFNYGSFMQQNIESTSADVKQFIDLEKNIVDSNLLIHEREDLKTELKCEAKSKVTANTKGVRNYSEQNIVLASTSGPHIRDLADSIFDSTTRQHVEAIQLQNDFFSDFNENDHAEGPYDHGFNMYECMGNGGHYSSNSLETCSESSILNPRSRSALQVSAEFLSAAVHGLDYLPSFYNTGRSDQTSEIGLTDHLLSSETQIQPSEPKRQVKSDSGIQGSEQHPSEFQSLPNTHEVEHVVKKRLDDEHSHAN